MTEPTNTGLLVRVAWLARLGKLRDGALIISGAIYVAGYLARAMHAYLYNLGVLPGVQFQYFVAGLMLLAPPLGLGVFLWVSWRLLKRLAGWAGPDPVRKQRVTLLIGSPVLVGIAAVFIGSLEYVAKRVPWVEVLGMGLMVGGFVLSVGYAVAAGEEESGATLNNQATLRGWRRVVVSALNRLGQALSLLMALNMGLVAVMVFVLAVLVGPHMLEHVPQELGGVNPKCGILDIGVEQLSTEMRASLIDPSVQPLAEAKVLRSRRLDVYSAGDPWLVKIPAESTQLLGRSYRLDKETVRSVEWCGPRRD